MGPTLLGKVPVAKLPSWKPPSPAEGRLLPFFPLGTRAFQLRIPQPRHFGELEAFQRLAPCVLAAMACCRLCPPLPRRALTAGSARPGVAGARILPDTHVSPS